MSEKISLDSSEMKEWLFITPYVIKYGKPNNL